MFRIGLFLSLACVAIGMPVRCSNPPLDVKYDGTYEVSCGAPLETVDTQRQPTVTWDKASQVSNARNRQGWTYRQTLLQPDPKRSVRYQYYRMLATL